MSNKKWKMGQIFVAFSEHPNFNPLLFDHKTMMNFLSVIIVNSLQHGVFNKKPFDILPGTIIGCQLIYFELQIFRHFWDKIESDWSFLTLICRNMGSNSKCFAKISKVFSNENFMLSFIQNRTENSSELTWKSGYFCFYHRQT